MYERATVGEEKRDRRLYTGTGAGARGEGPRGPQNAMMTTSERSRGGDGGADHLAGNVFKDNNIAPKQLITSRLFVCVASRKFRPRENEAPPETKVSTARTLAHSRVSEHLCAARACEPLAVTLRGATRQRQMDLQAVSCAANGRRRKREKGERAYKTFHCATYETRVRAYELYGD